jgi:hypothetical protein
MIIEAKYLRGNTVPTLAIIGHNDQYKACVDIMDGVMKNLKIKILSDCDHISVLFSPELVSTIQEFLSDNSNS